MSRSDDRSSSPEYDDRHRSRKKHRRHRRSRSRTRSRTPTIHVNPNFSSEAAYQFMNAPPPMFPNLSLPPPVQTQQTHQIFALQQANRELETSNGSLKQQLDFTNVRLSALENELRKVVQEKNTHLATITTLEQTKKKVLTVLHGTKQKVSGLEENLKQEKEKAQRFLFDLDEKIKENEMLRMDIDSKTQTCSFLTDRNAVLSKKCEELVTNQRLHINKIEAAKRETDEYKAENVKMRSDVDVYKAENAKLLEEARISKDRANHMHLERMELDRSIRVKEAEAERERQKTEKQRKADKEYITRLETSLNKNSPNIQNSMAVETVYLTIETIKKELLSQVRHLKEEYEIEVRRREAKERERTEELPTYLKTPKALNPQITMGMKPIEAAMAKARMNHAAKLRSMRSLSLDGSDIPGTSGPSPNSQNGNGTCEKQVSPNSFPPKPKVIKFNNQIINLPVLNGDAPKPGSLLKPLNSTTTPQPSGVQKAKIPIEEEGSLETLRLFSPAFKRPATNGLNECEKREKIQKTNSSSEAVNEISNGNDESIIVIEEKSDDDIIFVEERNQKPKPISEEHLTALTSVSSTSISSSPLQEISSTQSDSLEVIEIDATEVDEEGDEEVEELKKKDQVRSAQEAEVEVEQTKSSGEATKQAEVKLATDDVTQKAESESTQSETSVVELPVQKPDEQVYGVSETSTMSADQQDDVPEKKTTPQVNEDYEREPLPSQQNDVPEEQSIAQSHEVCGSVSLSSEQNDVEEEKSIAQVHVPLEQCAENNPVNQEDTISTITLDSQTSEICVTTSSVTTEADDDIVIVENPQHAEELNEDELLGCDDDLPLDPNADVLAEESLLSDF